MHADFDARIPNTSTLWQLWYSDTFDRDTSLSLETTGTNIVLGLYKLWYCTLKEGILDNGNASFSHFHLTWGNTADARVDVFVNPFNNPGLLKLRRWSLFMSDDLESEDLRITPKVEEQKNTLLLRLAQKHFEVLRKSIRWKASTIDWSAEAREILTRVDLISGPEEL